MGFLFSVCKGKQLYSESNRFSGYWSNKFRKCLCNYLFYREISKNRETPTASPDPSEGRGVPMRTRGIKGWALYLIVFCKILANLHIPSFRRGLGRHSPPFSGRLDGASPLPSEGLGEAVEVGWGFLFPNHTITITKSQKGFSMCKKGFLYNIIPY